MQSNETNGSYGMELEGLKRCKKELEGYAIKALVTVRHRQIAKWILSGCLSSENLTLVKRC